MTPKDLFTSMIATVFVLYLSIQLGFLVFLLVDLFFAKRNGDAE